MKEFNVEFVQPRESLIKSEFMNVNGIKAVGRTNAVFKMVFTGKYHSFFIILHE